MSSALVEAEFINIMSSPPLSPRWHKHRHRQKIIMSTEQVNWNTVPDGELFKWEKAGLVVEGVLINYRRQRDTGKGAGNIYEVQSKDGIVTFFAPSLLHQKLEKLPRPYAVRIELKEITKTKTGNTLKVFEVKSAPADEATLKIMGIELLKADPSLDDF